MFKEFLSLEISAAFRRPMVYIFLFIVALLSFGAVVSDNVVIGGSVGNVMKNAPYVITQFVGVFTLFGILFAIAFFNNAALRDYNNQFNEILFSTPLSKASFFFGRFFGALILATVPLLGVYIGVVLGSFFGPIMGTIEADRIGPLYLETFVNNYFLFILPNVFFAGSIIFTLAVKFKNTIVSFVGALSLLIAYGVSNTLLSDVDNETVAALADAFGVNAWGVESRYFTPMEKNTLSPGFSGLFFQNRLVWSFVGLIVLLLSYFSFSFKERNKKVKAPSEASGNKVFGFAKPTTSIQLSNLLQFKSFFQISFLSIVKSMVFKVIFLFALILMIIEFINGYEYFGLKSYPLTYMAVETVVDSTSLFLLIIMVFFSGELIWNDRNSNINEVINSTPHASLISLGAKTSALIGVISLLYFMFSLVGIGYQLILGFTNIEFDLYLLTFLYDELPGYIFWSVFFISLQVIINQKYQAYFISIILVIGLEIILSALDIQTNMVDLGSTPSLSYSDMNGFGPGLTSAFWFSLYWLFFAAILFLKSGLYWVRSSGATFAGRIKLALTNLNKRYGLAITVATILWIATGSFIYYNTQVLNSYKTPDELEELAVSYEKKYKKYEKVLLPKVQRIDYTIDIYPEERDYIAKANVVVKNESSEPIDSLHYNIDQDNETTIAIPGGELVFNDDTLGYQIYSLSKPMMPGDELTIAIEVKAITKGFENGRGSTSIVKNGTFLNNRIIPQMGYSANFELGDKNDRKKFDLPPKDRMPELYEGDSCTSDCMTNYLSEGRSDWVEVETIISTSEDQIAIAPGSLLKEWTENGRNYYHYKVDEPSQDFYSFISADYQVAKRDWNGISLEVYYDEKHDYNIDIMLDAIQKSLKYYTENFGPYYHKQARIIEFPNYNRFAQAFPGTMPYSESFGFITNLEDSTKNNVIDAVVAHEMAHQWWAHQVVGANMQGGTMLSESFSEYSSLMVMKQNKDDLGMKEFLKYDFNRYLRGRGSEREGELPLYKVENQQYIHYGKGSLVLYALQDYIGEEKVNRAMSNFLKEFRYKKPPYPTSLDFLTHLEKEVPDSLNYLIEDWFKTITLYDFRLENTSYTKLADDKYEVNFEVVAKKLKADTIGNETEVPLQDWVDLGVYKDADEKELLTIERVYFDKNDLNFSLIVDTIPAKAAIDPKRILIERVYKDNTKTIEEKKEES